MGKVRKHCKSRALDTSPGIVGKLYPPTSPGVSAATSNTLVGLKVSEEMLRKRLTMGGAKMPSVSAKSLNMKKRQRRQMKHDLFMHRVSSGQIKKGGQRRRMAKDATTAESGSDANSLEMLGQLLAGGSSKPSIVRKRPGVQTMLPEAKRRQKMLDNIDKFNKIQNSDHFRHNPVDAILQSLP